VSSRAVCCARAVVRSACTSSGGKACGKVPGRRN
jgi:hypothetical protein